MTTTRVGKGGLGGRYRDYASTPIIEVDVPAPKRVVKRLYGEVIGVSWDLVRSGRPDRLPEVVRVLNRCHCLKASTLAVIDGPGIQVSVDVPERVGYDDLQFNMIGQGQAGNGANKLAVAVAGNRAKLVCVQVVGGS